MSVYKDFQETEQMKNKIRQLKRLVKEMSAFDDKSCWNTSKDVVKAFNLDETKMLVEMILDL